MSNQSKNTNFPYKVQLVKRASIDSERWDNCVRNALNETPLAYTWVLDQLSPAWEGLIIEDYDGVMPVPVSKSIGIRMIQMPYEVLTLGIFSTLAEIIHLFPAILQHPVFDRFKFISYSGSPSKIFTENISGSITKQTYILDLNKPYADLYNAYSRNHRRSIDAFYSHNHEITEDAEPGNFAKLIKEIGQTRPELFIPSGYLKLFDKMMTTAVQKSKSASYSVWHEGQLVGASFFLTGNKRIIPYHVANSKGRVFKTSFALIDQGIKNNSGKEMILDFAGSVLPNVATFNRRFGARTAPYQSVTINRLPLPLKLAKKSNLLYNLKRIF